MIFWNEKTQQSIEKYFKSDDKLERNKIFSNELYNNLSNLTKQALFTCSSKIDEDDVQELLIHLSENVLPKLNEDLLKAAQQYIWISLKRRIYNMYEERKSKSDFINFSSTGDIIEFDYYLEPEEELEEQKQQEKIKLMRYIIIEKIDEKINNQEIINKKQSIFLILLKEYLFENNFDTRGFKNYCCKRMNIKNTSFSNLCSTLKIVNNDFYKDLIDERKITIEKANKYNNRKK